jgi:histone demethylase JARID1
MEAVSVESLEKLLDDATDLSIRKETYDKVESILTRTQEAVQHVQNLTARVTPGSVTNKPRLTEARRALKVLDELPAKPMDSIHFKKMVARTDEWVKRGKRLFGKTNASVNQLEDHLAFVLQRNEHVFDPLDIPKRDQDSSPRPDSPDAMEAKDSEDGPYCICRSGPTGEMVECDKCKEWYK